MFFNESVIQIIIIFAIFFIAMGYSAISHFSYSFLHFLLIFESMVLSVCLMFSTGSFIFDKIEGDIAVLFIIAIVAAETAIAISLYVRSTINPPIRFKAVGKRSVYALKPNNSKIFYIKKTFFK